MNTVLNCAQELSKDQFQFFEYLYCIESQAGPGVDDQIPGEELWQRLQQLRTAMLVTLSL